MLNENANVIYADVDEKVVKAVIVYPDINTDLLYWDTEFTKPVSAKDLKDLFMKDMLLIDFVVISGADVYANKQLAKPISMEDDGKVVGVDVIINGESMDSHTHYSAPYPTEEEAE